MTAFEVLFVNKRLAFKLYLFSQGIHPLWLNADVVAMIFLQLKQALY
jgi:hypothetical protein